MGAPDAQYDVVHHRLADLLVQDRFQLVTQHVELMHPDGIFNAEIQASAPEILDTCPLPDPTGDGPVPGSKDRKVTDHPTETQPLQAAFEDIRTPGRGGDMPLLPAVHDRPSL